MHEFGIAQGLLDAVLAKAQEISAPRITSIRLEIGVLSGIEVDALEFAFAALSEDTPAAKARLMIEKIPVRCYCERCKNIFECTPAAYTCPTCGEVSPDMRTGRELKLISMEID
jgi:hydrogenase nickel incorporation protein HypA/HybF